MKSRAFTLIELLIVVAIIAILAAIAVPNFLEAQTRAKIARAVSDMRSQATAIESYRVDNNAYPFGILPGHSPAQRWNWGFMPGGPNETTPANGCGGLMSPVAYMTSIPSDDFALDYIIPGGGAARAPKGSIPARFRIWNATRWNTNSVYTDASIAVSHATLMGQLGLPVSTPYIIVSPGPDKIENNMPAYSPAIYDATNGTISGGDLTWAGGGSIIN